MKGLKSHVLVTILLIVLPLAVVAPTAAGQPAAGKKGGPGPAVEHLRKSRDLEKKKDIDGALEACQEAFFLLPDDESLAAEVRRLSALAASARVKGAKEVLKTDREKAVPLFIAAHDLCPNKDAAAGLKSLGYTLHFGAWRTKEEIAVWERKDADQEKEAREKLAIGGVFRKHRSDHFRLFSDLPDDKVSDKWLEPLLKVLESLFGKYRWIFQREVGDAKDVCIDVVFFKDEGTYQAYRQRRVEKEAFRTAGYYDPNVRASFFYRQTGYGDVYPVLLHEVTHQLNWEVLQAATYLSFIAEGIAQYFEAAIVNPRDFTLTIGRPDYEAMSYLKERRLIGSSRAIPAKVILSAKSVDSLVKANYPTEQVYAEMWAWTYFLLHNETRHRILLLDCLRKEREFVKGEGAGDGWGEGDADARSPAAIYAKTFAAHGMPIETVDEDYKAFLQALPWSGRGKVAR